MGTARCQSAATRFASWIVVSTLTAVEVGCSDSGFICRAFMPPGWQIEQLLRELEELKSRGPVRTTIRDEPLALARDEMSNDPADVFPPSSMTAVWGTPKRSDFDFYTCDSLEIWCAAFFTNAGFNGDAIGQVAEEWARTRSRAETPARWDGATYRVSLSEDGSVAFVMLYLSRTEGVLGWVAVQPDDGLRCLTSDGHQVRKRRNASQSFIWPLTDSYDLNMTLT